MSSMGSTMHRRDLLTIHQLPEFRQFCESHGWTNHEPKGVFEVLRMKLGNEWLIVHRRATTLAGSPHIVHLTVWGASAIWAKKFYRQRKTA